MRDDLSPHQLTCSSPSTSTLPTLVMEELWKRFKKSSQAAPCQLQYHLPLPPSVRPSLHRRSSFSPPSTSLATHPYNNCILRVGENRLRLPSTNFTPSVSPSFALCLCSFSLTPECFSSLITCNSTSHLLLATGPICRGGSRTRSDVDLRLFSPGISDDFLTLRLICPVI